MKPFSAVVVAFFSVMFWMPALVLSNNTEQRTLLRRSQASNGVRELLGKATIFEGDLKRPDLCFTNDLLSPPSAKYEAKLYASDADARTVCVKVEETSSKFNEPVTAYIFVPGGQRFKLVYQSLCAGLGYGYEYGWGRKLSAGMRDNMLHEKVYLVLDSPTCNKGKGHAQGVLSSNGGMKKANYS